MYGNVLTIPGAAPEAEADDARRAPARAAADGAGPPRRPVADSQWELYEVFTQEAQGAPHEHAGSVRAADPAHALQNARDVYGRRGKVLSMWVVPTVRSARHARRRRAVLRPGLRQAVPAPALLQDAARRARAVSGLRRRTSGRPTDA
jgi:phenylacetate-CoA oxygenase PaaH subunit